MKKRLLTLLLALVACLTLCVHALAEGGAGITNSDTVLAKAQRGFDTMTFSNKEYLSVATQPARTEEDAIEHTLVAYLALNKAYVRDKDNYQQATDLIAPSARVDSTIEYRASETEYQAALNQFMGWKITRDKLSFSDYMATINSDTATARIVEDYEYYITDNFEDESFRRREYTFYLLKDNDGWKVATVATNDPWESEAAFSYEPIDVEGCIIELEKSINGPIETTTTENDGYEKEAVATTLHRWEYSAADAVSYAVAHVKDTSNSVFGFSDGNNCQNFASQCVWAGLGGSGASTSARPAVSQALAGSDGANLWQRNTATTCYGNSYWLNWTWDNTSGFAHMMRTSITTRIGPLGNTVYINAFPQTIVGNVLEVDWGGSPSRDSLDHAMFVTGVSGTAGNRTTADVKIAAHTSPTNSAYQTLSSYTSVPASYFARVGILAGYYDVSQ